MNLTYIRGVAFALLAAVPAVPAHAQESLSGTWSISRERAAQTVHLDLRTTNASGEEHDQNSNDVPLRDLGLTPAQLESSAGNHVAFALRREAGSVDFDGWLGSGTGGGRFTFAPSSAYVRAMRARGYTIDNSHLVLAAALLDITTAYADRIEAANLGRAEFEKLIAFRALGIDTPYIAQMRARFQGVDADNVISLRALNVTPEYLSELRSLGLDPQTAEEAVELRALHIDAAYVRDLASAGYTHLAPHDLVEMKALGIDAAYIRRVEAHGFHHLPVGKLIETKAMGVI